MIGTNKINVQKLDFQNILDHACQSVLMMELASLTPVNDNECCKLLYNRLYSDLPDMYIMTLQQSKEWHDLRKYRVTGSRVYELFTYSKEDWRMKSLKYFFPKSFTNKFVKHGIKHESDARDVFIKVTGMEVIECGMVISCFNNWLGYSPDGIIIQEEKPAALLEIKCLYKGNINCATNFFFWYHAKSTNSLRYVVCKVKKVL